MAIKNTLLLCLLFTFFATAEAQFRISVAYEPGYLQPKAHNQLISRHNAQSLYEREFRELHFLHGLSIGGRYDFEGIAIELNLFTKIANKLARNPAASSMSEVRNKLNYANYGIAFGAEAMFGPIGIGSDISYQARRINANFEFPDQQERFTQNTFGNKVYMTIHFRNEGATSVAIRPYAQFYWDAWDQGPLDAFINGQSTGENAEKFNQFGISFIFLNGN